MSADTIRQNAVGLSCGELPVFDDLRGLLPGASVQVRPMTIDQEAASVEVLVERLTAGDLAGAVACCLSYKDTMATSDQPAYPAVVLPAIRRMEEMWQTDALSFDKVIASFWLTRTLIERMTMLESVSRVRTEPAGTCLVALSVGEEHSFGAQMLADELRSRGCAVTLDLSASPQRINDLVAADRFDAVFLSINHDAALVGLADLIEDLRISTCNPRMKIMVGGSIFTGTDRSYAFLGCDGIGRSIPDAVAWFGAGSPKQENPRH